MDIMLDTDRATMNILIKIMATTSYVVLFRKPSGRPFYLTMI